jgi:3-methyladenine DNA glycosylase AlkD
MDWEPDLGHRISSMTAQEIKNKLRKLADREKAKILQGFFKTGPGHYGEGDVFLGITVPVLRKAVKECDATPLLDVLQLLRSAIHEERFFALMLLVNAYTGGHSSLQRKIYNLYLKNTRYINSWDLVDLSAPKIVGNYLMDKNREPLYALARSRGLWKKRIAILSTFHFIGQNDFTDTLRISELLLNDDHDLIHKAVGWMLREVGKRSLATEERFLKQYYRKMPRTMLRYAIERFPEAKRKKYLKGAIMLPAQR